jgi:predicted RNase H-like HicB family nuclease
MKAAPVTMTINFELAYEVRRKGGWFIAACPPVDVLTQGETEAEAVANLKAALELFFLSGYERGTLDRVF